MKDDIQLSRLLNELYWHCEHGEHARAITKLKSLQTDALQDAIRSIESPTPTANSPFTQGRNECCRLIRELLPQK